MLHLPAMMQLFLGSNGKPFTNGKFLKAAYINCCKQLFNGFSDKEEIHERIKEIPSSVKICPKILTHRSKMISYVISSVLDKRTDENSK